MDADKQRNDKNQVLDSKIPGAAYYALGVLTMVYSFNFIDRQLLAILQESIKADLGLKDAHLGLLTGFAFAAFYVTAGIPIARWADRANRRNIVALAVFTWSFMTSISGLAQNFAQLLLARIGVGVGEAGGSPPSHSMISDIFPPQKRATAMGLYSSGVNIGILFGFLLGGWLNEFFGWRVAFVVVGLPGILLAIIVRFTITEPMRGQSEARTASVTQAPLTEVLYVLWSRHSFRYLSMGAALNAFAGYATANWTASFMIRSHGMTTGELGTWLALILGLGGAIGVIAGGYISDKLSKRDKRWYMWMPVLALVVGLPFTAAAFTVDGKYMALACLIIPGIIMNSYLGNVIAMSHGLVGLSMRATASAILFFIINIIGLGLGPWSVGLLSDLLTPSFGGAALGMALLYIVPAIMMMSALFFYAASRNLQRDLSLAPD
ncbi:spinster family MFS transporter [Zhongshania aliphaticivorans]|jgi:predicted MFS family arabinose efflux permease|uniref:MFS transporter n=1 Tax=Zhongshania aliphaticivorans TaxID=1470434 RepID=A0A127M1Z3_9GAMM|nr:MFS transporter [Zhongshania aliphaticivorans]AMO67237.1 MFS transporter [Zhongshania aliphaticivorans]|tara:strand:+ start:17859 stop:19166 length:1308 start_codon:yes stop_codon:yes gene_type:complete